MANKKIDEASFKAAVKNQVKSRDQGWGGEQSLGAAKDLYKHVHGVEMPEDYAEALGFLINPSAVRQRIEGKDASDGSLINKKPEKEASKQKKFFSFKN